MKTCTFLTLIVAVLFIGACKEEAATPGAEGTSPTSTSAEALPPGHPPVNPGEGGMAQNPGGATIAWDFPANWKPTAPASSMRLAQATIPGSAGEGEVIVYFFGVGGGGGVEANLQRWEEQITGENQATRQAFESGAYRVSLVEKSGTLQPSTMGSGPQAPVPNSRMLAAVVEGEGGPWFFKATGPEATIVEAREAFLAMLRSIRPAGGTTV